MHKLTNDFKTKVQSSTRFSKIKKMRVNVA